jgi:hypothetical protein
VSPSQPYFPEGIVNKRYFVGWGAGLLVLGFVACHDTTSVEGPDVPVVSISFDEQKATADLDDWFAQVGRDVPGFAGAYLDESGKLVIALTDVQQETVARATISQHPERVRDKEFGTTVAAQFTFLEMFEWRAKLIRYLESYPEVHSIDIDEWRNKLVVGVENDDGLGRVEALMKQLGVPPEGMVLEVEDRLTPASGESPSTDGLMRVQTTHLNTWKLPARGGLLLQRRISSDSAGNPWRVSGILCL